jgi:hypothetical protein
MLTLCVHKYIFIADDELRSAPKGAVSVFILTEGDAGGFFL